MKLLNKNNETEEFVGFKVTGILTNNKRFKKSFDGTSSGYHTSMGINLFRGSVWGITTDNKRKLIKRVI